MRFHFDEQKAAQAAAHLISLHGDRINSTVLLKLLYLTDRAALLENGQPITGDRMAAMPHGPILSMILDRMNAGGDTPGSVWSATVSPPENYEVILRRDPGKDRLSASELELLDRIDDSFGHLNWRELCQIARGLPEFRDPLGATLAIEPEEVLRSEGRSSEEIERITLDAEELWFVDDLRKRAS